MISFFLLPIINYLTRLAETTATLIDNIFLNCMYCDYISNMLYADISDQLPVYATDMQEATTNRPEIILKRVKKDHNMFSI